MQTELETRAGSPKTEPVKPDFPEVSAAELKARRADLRLSQTALAVALGVSLPTVQRWEGNKSRIPAMVSPALEALDNPNWRKSLESAQIEIERLKSVLAGQCPKNHVRESGSNECSKCGAIKENGAWTRRDQG